MFRSLFDYKQQYGKIYINSFAKDGAVFVVFIYGFEGGSK